MYVKISAFVIRTTFKPPSAIGTKAKYICLVLENTHSVLTPHKMFNKKQSSLAALFASV